MDTTAPAQTATTEAEALPTGPTFDPKSEATHAELIAHLALVNKVVDATERGLIAGDDVPHLRGQLIGKGVGDTVVVSVVGRARYGVISHVARTGTLTVTYSTPAALTRARREWNRTGGNRYTAAGVHPYALAAARRAADEVAERQRVVNTDLLDLVRGVPGHDSDDAETRDRAARAGRRAFDTAQRWLDTHPGHVQLAYDRAYLDELKRLYVAIMAAKPWGALLKLSQTRIPPVPERPAPVAQAAPVAEAAPVDAGSVRTLITEDNPPVPAPIAPGVLARERGDYDALLVTVTSTANEYLTTPCAGAVILNELGVNGHPVVATFRQQDDQGGLGAPVSLTVRGQGVAFVHHGGPDTITPKRSPWLDQWRGAFGHRSDADTVTAPDLSPEALAAARPVALPASDMRGYGRPMGLLVTLTGMANEHLARLLPKPGLLLIEWTDGRGHVVRGTFHEQRPDGTLSVPITCEFPSFVYHGRDERRPGRVECRCVTSCAEDPATACSLSGEPHVHPDNGAGLYGPCPLHPDAPGDL